MGTINKNSFVDPSLSDLIALWQNNNGRTRSTSLNKVFELFEANITIPNAGVQEAETQYNSPGATGFSVQVGDNIADGSDIHLILTPLSGYANGTIVLPLNTTLRDKQIIVVNTTQQITNLTLDPNGAAGVTGDLTSMGADDYFTIKYDSFYNTWYRIG